MFKVRGGIAVIVATIIGVVLLIVAVSKAQEAMAIKSVDREDVFTITGKARFSERAEKSFYQPKMYVYVEIDPYPASFIVAQKTEIYNAVAFKQGLDTTATIRVAIPKSALALLYTRSVIKPYELSTINQKSFYSFSDALKRDKRDRLSLYVQAALCLLGGLVLLIYPKKYLLKV